MKTKPTTPENDDSGKSKSKGSKMSKKSTPVTPASDDNDDLSSLLGTLNAPSKSAKKDDYDVLKGHEKEVDKFCDNKEKIDVLDAELAFIKSTFTELGKKHNITHFKNETVGFAGTGDNKLLFSPTCKYSGTPLLNEEKQETEEVQKIRDILGENFKRATEVLVNVAVKTEDQKRLREFIKYSLDGGFMDCLVSQQLLTASTWWHENKYKLGLKQEQIDYIDSILKPVNQIKLGKKKKK